jgi:hypothetical protein
MLGVLYVSNLGEQQHANSKGYHNQGTEKPTLKGAVRAACHGQLRIMANFVLNIAPRLNQQFALEPRPNRSLLSNDVEQPK